MHAISKETEERPIGFLAVKPGERGYRVVGMCCAAKAEHTPSRVWRVNVWPYKQTCRACGRTLVSGATLAWPELFNGK